MSTKPRVRSRTLRVRLLKPVATTPAIAAPDGDPATGPETSNSAPAVATPTPVTPLRPRTLAGGDANNCVLDTSGTAWCWGKFGGTVQLTPAAVVTEQPFFTVATSAGSGCGLSSFGAAQCWQDAAGRSTLATVPGDHRFRFITGGSGNRSGFCALDEVGSAWCWGEAPAIIHGQGDEPWGKPRQVATGLGALLDVSLSQGHICVIDSSRQAWCWGANHIGQLGTGTNGLPAFNLTTVPNSPASSAVASGARHSCSLATDATIWCWGTGEVGQLGLPDLVNSPAPAQRVMGGTNYLVLPRD